MRHALRLAARARGSVEPNPLVGAVVVRKGRVVGTGYHRYFGGPHAEVYALKAAGAEAKGATLYVTLEPCCHFGKTPPCTDAVLAAGVARVVVAMVDPFAKVRGRGVKKLRAAGVAVDVGLLREEAQALNAPFIKRVATGLPYVIAKWAQTLDGCIATATGESKWISSDVSRGQVQVLRGRVDAIVVGLGTALADDPLLMARPASARDLKRTATRIVLDSRCKLPPTCQLVRTLAFAPVMVAHLADLDRAAERRRRVLAERGVITVPLPADGAGRPALAALLRVLGGQEYTNILVEGGPELMAAFVREGLVDEAHVYIAPKVIGGQGARHAIGGPDLAKLALAPAFEITAVEQAGPDLHVVAKPARRRR